MALQMPMRRENIAAVSHKARELIKKLTMKYYHAIENVRNRK